MEKVQLTVTLELGVETREAIAQLVHAIENHGGTPAAKRNPKANASKDASDEEETSTISIAEIKKQRGKRGKKAAEPEPEEEDTEELEELEELEEDEVEADDESEREDFSDEGEEEEADEDTLSDEQLSKLKAALKAHSSKHGDKKKTVAILNKFAKRSDLVKPADLPKLMKLLKK